MKKLFFMAFVMAIVMAGQSRSQVAEDRTITVCGQASSELMPDRVIWALAVGGKGDDPHDAQEKSEVVVQQVKEIAASLGFEDRDLEIGKARIHGVWKRDKQGNRTDFSHYEINRSIIVHQNDMSRFEEFMDAFALDTGLEVNTRYYSTQLEAEQDRLRLQAMKDARSKAEKLAGVVKCEVGHPLMISEFKPAGTRSEIDHALAKQAGARAPRMGVPELIKVEMRVFATFELACAE